jgi:serine/threonine-protein kinase
MSALSEVPPITGLIAGKYQITRLLGRGGMGSVWEGRHATLGTRVAIKLIDSEFLESPEARQRFENEARAAASIESRFAVTIFDYGVSDDGHPYIVMEFLQGESLDRRIERQGRLSLEETCKFVGQTARALQKAHAVGVVHRDLKPDNIYIVNADDEEIAKLLDFGIAKFRAPTTDADSRAAHSATKTGTVIGTPFYMSPEQARGLRSVDYRTDLWSLGVIAYTCVTGALPFEGESTGDLLVKICTAVMPVPTRIAPWLPATFDLWFARALQRDPEARFQSAQELSDALIAVTSGYPLPFAMPRTERGAATPPTVSFPQAGYEHAVSAVGPSQGGFAGQHGFAGTDAGLAMSRSESRKRSTRVIVGAGVAVGVGLLGGLAVVMALSLRRPDVQAGSEVAPPVSAATVTSTGAPAEPVPTSTIALLPMGAPPSVPPIADAGPRVETTRPIGAPIAGQVRPLRPLAAKPPKAIAVRPPSRPVEPPPSQQPPPAYTAPPKPPPQPHDPAGF